MKLSKNLTLKEVIKSKTAIRLGIDNSPTDEHLKNLICIAENVFQKVRDHFGISIGVSSGYRSKALNDAIPKSSKTSQHCFGEALDLDADMCGGVTNLEIFNYIKDNLIFHQLIMEFPVNGEPSWIHVSYKRNGKNRNQVLVANKVSGETVYSSYKGSL